MTTEKLLNYKTEISEIVLFAKRINYNIENGIEGLMLLWLQDGLKFQQFVKDNKADFIRTTKTFIN